MSDQSNYDSNLAMGLGLIEETKILLRIWSPQLDAIGLYERALASGLLPNVTAYRLRNIVVRCFSPRYLGDGAIRAIAAKGDFRRALHHHPSVKGERQSCLAAVCRVARADVRGQLIERYICIKSATLAVVGPSDPDSGIGSRRPSVERRS